MAARDVLETRFPPLSFPWVLVSGACFCTLRGDLSTTTPPLFSVC